MFVSDEATILHADLDSFYASVEQRDDPRLRGRPVIVGGGVVLAASYEAKALRRAHARWAACEARRLCPDAVVVPPRMSAYAEASKAVFEVFNDTTPLVEGISIDEAFLDVGGLRRLVGPPVEIAAAAEARRPRAGRLADHGRRGPDEVPRQGGERRGEARWPAARAARRRARVPPSAAGRAAVGRRRGHRGEAPPPRGHDRRRGRPARRARAGVDARPRRRAATARAVAQPRSETGAGRAAARIHRLATRAGSLRPGHGPTSRPPWPDSSTA